LVVIRATGGIVTPAAGSIVRTASSATAFNKFTLESPVFIVELATGSFAAPASGGIVLVTNKPNALTLKAVFSMGLATGGIVTNHLDVTWDIVSSAIPNTNYFTPSRYFALLVVDFIEKVSCVFGLKLRIVILVETHVAMNSLV
jgi:hypothetical protein